MTVTVKGRRAGSARVPRPRWATAPMIGFTRAPGAGSGEAAGSGEEAGSSLTCSPMKASTRPGSQPGQRSSAPVPTCSMVVALMDPSRSLTSTRMT